MNKIWLVTRREYLWTVRRKGFIITTIGMPLFFSALIAISAGAQYLAFRSTRATAETVGLVDESGVVRFNLLERVRAGEPKSDDKPMSSREIQRGPGRDVKPITNLKIQRFETRQQAHDAFVRKELRGYYVVPTDYVTRGEVELGIKTGSFMADDEPGWNAVERLLDASLLEGKLEDKMAERIWRSAKLKRVMLKETGEPDKAGEMAGLTGFLVPYAFTLFFMLSILFPAGYLLQSVAEEKENRVIEILLSSLTPDQLLAGKVLGLCGAGLTQIAAWSLIGIAPAVKLLPFLDLRWSQLAIALVFFVLGFLLFGTLMGGFGSLGNNAKESQQMSAVWTILAVSPMFFLAAILAQPNGVLARVMSFIPLTAPITIVLRTSATRVPWWEVILSAVILMASLVLFIRLAAKMFRLGVLMYGKRPTLGEIFKWLRSA